MIKGILFLKNFRRQSTIHGETLALYFIIEPTLRFIIEFFRQPDAHLGLLWFKLSMGQLLSIPMIIIGVLWFWKAYQKSAH